MNMAAFLLLELLLEDDDEELANSDDDIATFIGPLLVNMIQKERRVRIQNYVEDVVSNYTDTEFRRMFRLSRPCFEALCEMLSQCPEMYVRSSEYGGREQMTLIKTVLIALRYLGHPGNIRTLSDIFNVSDSSVIVCRRRVFTALVNNLKNRVIRWPLGPEQAEVLTKFQEKKGFPGVLGALDSTHIQIKAPSDNAQDYVNRKGYHSLILQAVCLPDMTLSHCFTGWPGSCPDSRVLRNSNLWEEGPVICGRNHILGDGAYPLKPWLMTPYRDNGHLTARQRRYNYAHSSTRTVVERAFAQLKGRFRRLQSLEVNSIQTAIDTIMSACVLHNICILNADNADDFAEEILDGVNFQNLNAVPGLCADGILKRDEIANNLN